MIRLPQDHAKLDIFWDEELESYILALHKGTTVHPVRMDAASLSMLMEEITRVLDG